jgi:hypothetical protein
MLKATSIQNGRSGSCNALATAAPSVILVIQIFRHINLADQVYYNSLEN